ncbi:MAG: host attachment protein [Campylobacterales bacterium]|nr:host attachment protein [Campylobacterales bacterium]
MSSELIIVADLQRFKLYSIQKEPLGREYVELHESTESLETHQKLSEKVSDKQGHFQSSDSIGVCGSGSGENHNIALEEERRRIKEIAKQISEALQKYNYTYWYFAAPKAINNQIVELLEPSVGDNMKINLHLDLTKIPDDQLLDHFKNNGSVL